MQRGTNHVEQSSDENGRKSARNKTMRRGTKEQKKWPKISKEQNHVHGTNLWNNGTNEQRKR
jgi:hypothetical protein